MRVVVYKLSWLCIIVIFISPFAFGKEILINNSKELYKALKELEAGMTVIIAPGNYTGDIFLKNINGTNQKKIIIKGLDPVDPPIFTGRIVALHMADCSYVILKNLVVKGFTGNGINIDDGGDYETPSRHIFLENLTILNTGPQGNHDALKLSGVDHFIVRNCRFEGWGGSAIDMVGSHFGIIENCIFKGRKGFSQRNGVQMKGGSSNIRVHKSFFRNAGDHAIKIGGHTGLKYFRPRNVSYEAKDITVAGNRFIGSDTPISWITAINGNVQQNTIVFPKKSVLRILQSRKSEIFAPCQKGNFAHNLVVYNAMINKFLHKFVEIGQGTLPTTFTFQHNAWFQVDGLTIPSLPTQEINGVYQVDPKLDGYESATMLIRSKNSLLKGIGADSYLGIATDPYRQPQTQIK